MKSTFRRFADDETGATAIEYGLIAGLISVVLIVSAQMLGTKISNDFAMIAGNL